MSINPTGKINNNKPPRIDIPDVQNHQQKSIDDIFEMVMELKEEVKGQKILIDELKQENKKLNDVNEELNLRIKQVEEVHRKSRITTGASLGVAGGFLLSSFLRSSPVSTVKNVITLTAVGALSGDGYHKAKVNNYFKRSGI